MSTLLSTFKGLELVIRLAGFLSLNTININGQNIFNFFAERLGRYPVHCNIPGLYLANASSTLPGMSENISRHCQMSPGEYQSYFRP